VTTKLRVLGLSACAMVFSAATMAQQRTAITFSGEGVKSRYVQQLVIDVDDMPGHQVRVQEAHRTYPDGKQPMVDGEWLVEVWIRGFSNYTGGVGPAWGYNTWVTEKGDKIFGEYSGTSESITTESGAKRGTYHGTARWIGGTGRFSKIRALFVEEAKFDTDPKTGYNLSDSRGEYWFEK
jgi:hypothetical protein